MSSDPIPTMLPAEARRRLRILLIARHAGWDEGLHPQDGNHAPYHAEMRRVLEEIGVRLSIAESYEALFAPPPVDFVFPLLNRGGFLNSEMLLPLLCERAGLPYLGACPIVRGLADDKHLAKQAARARGVPTAPWAIYRRGGHVDAAPPFPARAFVVKPNASSASWGVGRAGGWGDARAAVGALHAEGHDAIVEPFVVGHDVEVPAITLAGAPHLLPAQIVEQDDPRALRSYAEKRDLGAAQAYRIRPLEAGPARAAAEALTHRLIPDFTRFDYGRFEFRLDVETGALLFMEVNLNCNLWSRKTIAMAAAQIGWSHRALIETILTESLAHHGLLRRGLDLAA